VEQSNVLVHPVYIPTSSHVENSIIGPNVSIGENCSIKGAIIRNSIVDDNSNLTETALENALIGKSCSVAGNPGQLVVGDYDDVQIGYTTVGKSGTEQHSPS
jgi:glucose-1-phosphate thymidylyltransferase